MKAHHSHSMIRFVCPLNDWKRECCFTEQHSQMNMF